MSTIYLVRHGQAGTREDYDRLSDLGHQQARLLAEYFDAQKVRFDQVISGSLKRQKQTAEAVSKDYVVDPNWDEFDLTRVYREIAPQLCANDAVFARLYDELKEQMRASAGSKAAAVHREWHPCDSMVVQAWMSGRYEQEGETWQQFHDRIAACVTKLRELPDDQQVAIFTSATPIGIWGGLALDVFDQRSLRLAGVVHNSSYTVFKLRNANLRLFTFNATPHLADAEMRTHR